ncbi:xylulokinase [Salinibacter grassmerensis]|uniref:xylulokinase n=1 Tax=Salinibacter grassmerensis TaxID=3040353 RepID=UPI0021E78A31|nr:FGGY family carbohydrate kinase [Salinibacter grassmerensis]
MLLGYDIGSSAIKAALLDPDTGNAVASARAPSDHEMSMEARHPGWAEQPPGRWWRHVQAATDTLRSMPSADLQAVRAIGLTYQMHGLVLVNKAHEVLRPSIIWCDSRAVDIGREAFEALGREWCLSHLLNSPGNFTAAKLAWVKRNEPEVYGRVHKAMLPGDYLALKLTGTVRTTPSGLSEGTLWDVQRQDVAVNLLDYFDLDPSLWPETVPTFSEQGTVTASAASTLGVPSGVPVAYRAGDQPNNAFSLNVLEPGEVAATAGTSGVIYGVGDTPGYDRQSRVNTFLHVNHEPGERLRYGTLMCVNGTGILNRWLRGILAGANGLSYEEMNEEAAQAPIGAAGLTVLPFGNGAERTLGDRDLGASVHGLNFNVHGRPHLLRAAQEGIVFALRYGLDIMQAMGLSAETVRAGHANMFLSPLFATTFATLTDTTVELLRTDGSEGAARGAGVGAGLYSTPSDAFEGLEPVKTVSPNPTHASAYAEAYDRWTHTLAHQLNRTT